MPVFPDLSLLPLSGPLEPSNGALPPSGSSGVMPGLDSSLMALLRNYRPGDIGICEVADKIQISLPIPWWYEYGDVAQGNISGFAAGTGDTGTMLTVPADERWMLESVRFGRVGGDNTINRISVAFPVGYGSGDRTVTLQSITGGSPQMYWPNNGGGQAVGDAGERWGPMLLEPGALLTLTPNSVGVAATTFGYIVVTRRTKLVLVP